MSDEKKRDYYEVLGAVSYTHLDVYKRQTSLRDQGLAGGADVLGHGNHHGGRGRKGHNGLLPGQSLLVLGVDAAVKGKCHEYHHLF